MPDLQSLREAVENNPIDISLLLLLGQGLLDADALEEASDAFNKVLSLEPAQNEARLGVAQILFRRGAVSEAAVRAEAILGDDERFANAHLLLSRLHLAEENRSEAIEEYQRAIEADRAVADRTLEQELGIPHLLGSPAYVEDSLNELFSETGPFADENDADETLPFDTEDEVLAEPVEAEVSFADVGGLNEVKEELQRRWILPLRNPGLAKAYKIRLGGGVLLYGPPGCGKSLLAESVAGESGCRIIHVGIHEILDPYFGSSERNLYQVLETAREEAPVVVLIDHIDTIAGDRQRLRDNQARNLVNQFLHQLHLLSRSSDRVLVIGCTDTPWHLDRAFFRPGRFGKPLFVAPPSRSERLEILTLLAEARPTTDLDLPALANATRSFSGADLKAIFDLATEQALEAATSGGEFQPLDTESLFRARRAIHPSTTAWFRAAQKNIPRAKDDEAFAAVREAVTNNRHA